MECEAVVVEAIQHETEKFLLGSDFSSSLCLLLVGPLVVPLASGARTWLCIKV